MNIDLPVQFKDIKLNDREKIFAWMIVELSKKLESPRWELVSLFLSKFDVTHILGRTDGNRLTNLRKVFNIAIQAAADFFLEFFHHKLQIRYHSE